MRRRSVLFLRLAVILLVVAAGLALAAWRFGPLLGRTPFRSYKTHIAEVKSDDAAPPLSPAEDWPAWRGPRGDGISRETDLAERWPEGGPRKVWSAAVGLGYASPVATGGRVYLFSLDDGRDALTCFDARTGHILWNDESDTGKTRDFPGTRATPAIDGNAIYTYGATGELTRHNLATGKPGWRVNVMDLLGERHTQYGCGSSPLVAMGKVFVQGGRGGPVAAAFDKETGKIAWQSEARTTGGFAHPVLIDVTDAMGGSAKQLVIFGGEALYDLDPATGRTIWSQAWATNFDVNASTPVYSPGDRNLFATSAYGKGSILLRLSPDGAKVAWKKPEVKSKFQPAIRDGALLFINSAGWVKCMTWPTGAPKWEAGPDDVRIGENGSIVRVGDKLVGMSDEGLLYLMRATPEGFSRLAEAQVFDDKETWATPLLYGGRLYAKGTREFACFDVSAGSTAPATRATSPTSKPGEVGMLN